METAAAMLGRRKDLRNSRPQCCLKVGHDFLESDAIIQHLHLQRLEDSNVVLFPSAAHEDGTQRDLGYVAVRPLYEGINL